jgi:hypothetical protein
MRLELGPMSNPNDLLSKIEHKRLWAYFHKDWIVEIRNQLRQQLPDTHHVFVESETIFLSPDTDDFVAKSMPDIAVVRATTERKPQQLESTVSNAAVIEYDEHYELYSKYSLTIRRSPENVIVAAVEVLSPSNKGIGNRLDRGKYLLKRDSYLEAGINFLEIDALTEGESVVPHPIRKASTFDRHVWTCFHDDGVRRLRAYGWNSDQPIPTIPWRIEGELSVGVDLGKAAAAAFEFNRWQSFVAKS